MTVATFLMLVTPNDCGIARYAIESFARLSNRDDRISLVVYGNGIDAGQEDELRRYAGPHRRITVRSNSELMKKIEDSIAVGKLYTDDRGRKHLRFGRFENCDEVWSRELPKLGSVLVGIIDADFEILDASFVGPMLDEFAKDESLAFYASDYTATHRAYEVYSRQHAVMQARYHTWFCLYRRAALEAHGDFTFTEEVRHGETCKYDSGAMMQEILIGKYGYKGKALDPRSGYQFIHYGAFSKNRSLGGPGLAAYRLIRIGRHNGWFHKHRSRFLARVLRAAFILPALALEKCGFDKERQRFPWNS
jgi:hypothetical protein